MVGNRKAAQLFDGAHCVPGGRRVRGASSVLFPARPMLCLLAAALLSCAAPGQTTPTQNMQQPGRLVGQPGYPNLRPGMPGPRPGAPAPAAATPLPSAVAAPSLLDQPAQPAKVDLAAGKLTIKADNSSLSAILQQVSTSAGMTVDGLSKDERVFGTYGPGDPREILSSLLDGSGYNVVMFGKTTLGTPSQLALSTRGAALPSGSEVRRAAIVQNQEDEEEPAPTQYQDTPPPPQANPQPGPGGPTTPNGGVRTPQQMLQELQQMRQQPQQQQQQQDQQQPPQ